MAGWASRLRRLLGGSGIEVTPQAVAPRAPPACEPRAAAPVAAPPAAAPQPPAAAAPPATEWAPASLILPPLPDSDYPRSPRRQRPMRLSYDRDGAAPLAPHGAAMEAVKRRVLERVRELGFETAIEPDLRLSIDGEERRVRETTGERHVFDLPAGTGRLRLLSRVSVPALMFADSHDDRRLGVFVGRIVANDGTTRRELALDDPALVDGWYPPEIEDGRPFRWTNGDAALPIALDGLGPATLEIEVGRVVPSWV